MNNIKELFNFAKIITFGRNVINYTKLSAIFLLKFYFFSKKV